MKKRYFKKIFFKLEFLGFVNGLDVGCEKYDRIKIIVIFFVYMGKWVFF